MQLNELLTLLASGEPSSVAALAAQLGVSRAAMMQQIKALRGRGVPIEARGSSVYGLPWSLQMLDEAKIRTLLPAALAPSLGTLEVHWELDSTSSELQRRGAACRDFSVVLAETQYAGRGRRGREWLSPPGLSIHLSCLKRFDAGFLAVTGLSLAVGVMVLRALQSLGIDNAGLKWPNDVLVANGDQSGGKLGGILVELSGEYQGPCAAIIGIGLNQRLSSALRQRAGQRVADVADLADGRPPDRNRLAAALVATLVEGLREFELDGFAAFSADYARYDLLRDQPLTLSGALETFSATGAGVDATGALQVRLDDGSTRRVDSADVTVRCA